MDSFTTRSSAVTDAYFITVTHTCMGACTRTDAHPHTYIHTYTYTYMQVVAATIFTSLQLLFLRPDWLILPFNRSSPFSLPLKPGFPNSVLGPPLGARFGICPSTKQLIQIIKAWWWVGYLNQLCSARAKTKNVHPGGSRTEFGKPWPIHMAQNEWTTEERFTCKIPHQSKQRSHWGRGD